MAETRMILKGGEQEVDLLEKAKDYYNTILPKHWKIKENNTIDLILRHPERKDGFILEEKKKYKIEDILDAVENHRKRQFNKQIDHTSANHKEGYLSAYADYIAEKDSKIILSEGENIPKEDFSQEKQEYVILNEYDKFRSSFGKSINETIVNIYSSKKDAEAVLSEGERVVNVLDLTEEQRKYLKEKSNRDTNKQMIGGTIREIAGKSLSDKNYLYLFDEGTKNTIEAYLKTKPNLEPIELTSKDYLAISNVLEKEKNLGIELSSEKREKIVSLYYELYQAKEKQELKQQNMETQQTTQEPTQSKKFDVAEYLNNQMKYLGFGDNYKETIQKHLDSAEKSFQIQTTSDRVMEGNQVDFAVNFNKSEKGGVFLNSFNARLITQDGEERSHNFKLNFTAKEAINLLEGRAVKTEFNNSKTNEPFESFVKLKFNEPKNEYDNYKLEFHKANEIDTAKIVELSGLKFEKPEYRDFVIKSLEKGNITNVKFTHEGNEIEGKAILNTQYKNLNLYDKDMNRVNTNKPLQGLEQDNNHEKSKARQQNISRSI